MPCGYAEHAQCKIQIALAGGAPKPVLIQPCLEHWGRVVNRFAWLSIKVPLFSAHRRRRGSGWPRHEFALEEQRCIRDRASRGARIAKTADQRWIEASDGAVAIEQARCQELAAIWTQRAPRRCVALLIAYRQRGEHRRLIVGIRRVRSVYQPLPGLQVGNFVVVAECGDNTLRWCRGKMELLVSERGRAAVRGGRIVCASAAFCVSSAARSVKQAARRQYSINRR